MSPAVVLEPAEQVLGIVEIRHEIDFPGSRALLAIQPIEVSQGGKVRQREANGVEYRHFKLVRAPGRVPGQDVAELRDREPGLHLLYLALDPALRLELDDDTGIGPAQDVRVELRFPGQS